MECIEEFSKINNNLVSYSNNFVKGKTNLHISNQYNIDNNNMNQVKANLRDEKPINLTPKENLIVDLEISNQDTFKAVYLNYEDLLDFEKEENLENLTFICVEQIIDVNNFWINVFEAINTLRRILKYYPQNVEKIIHKIISSILKHCKSIRSNLAKVSLMFVSEMLNQFRFHTQDLLIVVLPLLFQINGQKEKRFLSEEAEKALEAVVSFNFSYNTLCIIINGLKEKNLHTSASAFKTFENFIKLDKKELIFDNNLDNKDYNNEIFNLLKLCSELFELKKEPYCKRSLIILNWLIKCCSKEKIISIFEMQNNGKVYENYLKMTRNSDS